MVAIDSTYFSFGSANSSSSAFSSGVGTGCCDWWCFEVILIPPALTVKKIQLKNQITSESKMWLQPSCPRTTSKISGNIFSLTNLPVDAQLLILYLYPLEVKT